MKELIGQQLDNYRIESLLGEGGMGAVFKARDLNLNRIVAIKVMDNRLAKQEQFQQRFQQEAQAAARLKHPSIVQVFHFNNYRGILYMAMTYVAGHTLGKHLRLMYEAKQVILLNETLGIVAQVADALGYAHRQGVVHRDVKPDNVLLETLEMPEREGEPPVRAVVTDFGLAKLLEGGIQTQTGTFLGTMPYMSPEQCRGLNIDGRSDIYSLGVMLYQMTTGRLPFENIRTPAEAAEKHIRMSPPRPQDIRPGLPIQVEEIILRSIAKNPDDRYQTGAEMAHALRRTAGTISDDIQTQIAATTSIISLITQILPEEDAPVPPSIRPSLIAPTGADYLVIQRQGEANQTYSLDKTITIIGRTDECDILLEAPGISRRHARLERSTAGWQIIDLGSSNGTWMKDRKLLPNVPEPWEPGQVARIGPYLLRWQPAQKTSAGAPSIFNSMPSPPSGATQLLTNDGQLGVIVNPTNVEVAPGKMAEVQVELFNQSAIVDQFDLRVEGLPATWITIPPEPVQLMPQANVSLPFTIHPPENSSSRAGRHPYRLAISSQSEQRDITGIDGNVIVTPFTQFSVDVQPTRLTNSGKCRVVIVNDGNTATTFDISGRDDARSIQFSGKRTGFAIPAGESAEVLMDVTPKERPLVGTKQPFPFEIKVMAANGAAQVRPGLLEVKPRFSTWLIAIAPLLAILCCIGIVFGGQTWLGYNEQTATAQVTQTALAQTTLDAANDTDMDGLSDAEEQQLGTDPSNPDSDNDGLSDGEENNVHFTNPLNPDSDDDGLKDGDEIQLGTFVNVPDSDGDGQFDGIDAAPLATSTATPDFEATQAVQDATVANATATALAAAAANEATSTALAHAAETAVAQQTAQAIFAQQTVAAQQTINAQIAQTQTAEAMAVAQTLTAEAQAANATATSIAATATAQANLVAHYPLETDGKDITNRQGDMTLTNAPFVDDGIYCNGVYPSGNDSACFISTPNLNGFNYNSFSISMQFSADQLKRMPVFVGGRSFRWLGFELHDDGSIKLLYNNSNRESCTVTYQPNQWHTALITYDGSEAKLYLDRILGCTASFDLQDGNDKDVSVANFSNATIFKGKVRDLRIYNEAIIPLPILINPVFVVTPVFSP